MKVHLSRIAEAPVHQHLRLRAESLERFAELTGGAEGEIEADTRLRMLAETVEVTGTVRVALSIPCAMCLAPVAVHLEAPLLAVQVPAKAQADLPDDIRLSDGELDVDFFEGDEIDLTALVEEEVLLMLPPSVTCSEDCQGVCAGCGRNLNETSCVCEPDTGDHPFAALKDLMGESSS